MNNVEEILKKSWDSIKPYQTGSLQLNIEHPLEWHVAYETPTNKALVILAHYQTEGLDSSKSISTTCNRRDDGSYYISFQLTEKSQEDVFISMCSNLIEYSEGKWTEIEALNKVEMRYRQWRRLMEYKNLAILSDEKRRGLIGELLYLKKIVENEKTIGEALAGWVGPNGADQDFVYDSMWREIKTTGLSSDRIEIHSVEQLGDAQEEGELIIYRVDPCAPETKDAFSLRSLIKGIISTFNGELTYIEQFTSKLNAVGYIDMEVYDRYFYKYFKNDIYKVNSSFPRITRSLLRAEIIKCDYSLSIASINEWKRS